MSDIVGALGSLFPVLNSHPWAMAALIGVVVVAVAMWLAPRIIVATESLINIRSRLKDPDDWPSRDSCGRAIPRCGGRTSFSTGSASTT